MGCLKISYQSRITVIDEKQIFVDFGYEKNARTKNICSNYYPFGMLQPNRHGGESYRYNFQGQETDDELKGKGNSVSYKYRMHDPRLGRFFAVDPLTSDYAHNSAYAFSENVVINAVELEGLEKQVVTYGIKKSKKLDDDNFVKMCGSACAQKMGVKPQGISTGKNLLSIMKAGPRDESLSVYVNFGHSWNNGFYLTDNNGFYKVNKANGAGSASLSDMRTATKNGELKISKHSLFIFASCGTSGNGSGAAGQYDSESFSASFGDYIDKTSDLEQKEYTDYYKVTTIGATGLSNLKTDGTVKTDGKFIKTEKLYKMESKLVANEVSIWGFVLFKAKYKVKTTLVKTQTTNLGSTINPSKIASEHDDKNTTIQ